MGKRKTKTQKKPALVQTTPPEQTETPKPQPAPTTEATPPPAGQPKTRDPKFNEILSSITQIMKSSGTSMSNLDNVSLSDLLAQNSNLKNLFERSLVTRIDEKGSNVVH